MLTFREQPEPASTSQRRHGSSARSRRTTWHWEDPADVDAYAELFDHLRARALGPDESRALIARLADETS